MRVTYLSAVGALGGAERCLIDMARVTRESGIECSAVLLDDGPLVEELQKVGVEVTVQPLPAALAGLGDSNASSRAATVGRLLASSPRLFSFIRKLRATIARTHPTIVHSNGFKTHLLSRFVAPKNARLIWHMHDFVSNRALMRILVRAAVKRAVEIVAVSRAVADDVATVFPSAKTTCIYNAIDCDVFSPGEMPLGWLEQQASVPLPTCGDSVKVGLVATYAKWKGHEVFINAIALLPPEVRRLARFYIVGGPIYRTSGSQWQESELRALASSAGVATDIVFVPFHSSPADVFRALDIVVHASTAPEPFGRTIVEAMATARAVIAAPSGGAAELIISEVSAVAAESNSPAKLAHALARLVMDARFRNQLAAAGRQAVLEQFSLPRLRSELSCFYRKPNQIGP